MSSLFPQKWGVVVVSLVPPFLCGISLKTDSYYIIRQTLSKSVCFLRQIYPESLKKNIPKK